MSTFKPVIRWIERRSLIAVACATVLLGAVIWKLEPVPHAAVERGDGEVSETYVAPPASLGANFTVIEDAGACGNLFTGPIPIDGGGSLECAGALDPGRYDSDDPSESGGGGITGGGRRGGPGGTTGGGGPGGGTTGGGRRGDPKPYSVPEWRSSGKGLPMSPTTGATFSPEVARVEGFATATDLWNSVPEERMAALGRIGRHAAGTVELGNLGLIWGEIDASFRGVTEGSTLLIGRRYFSRLNFNGDGSVGARWVHSFTERLIFNPDGSILHFDWKRPYNDPDEYFVEGPTGTWTGPGFLGAEIHADTTSWPGAAFRMDFKAQDTHYFDKDGKILARVDWSGQNAISFSYDVVTGDLDSVTDSRGKVFDVETTNGLITTITDPLGHPIDYVTSNGQLIRVDYPKREVFPNGGIQALSGSGGVFRHTHRHFFYDANGFLNEIQNDLAETTHRFTYSTPTGGRVHWATNARGGNWIFEDFPGDSIIAVKDPRHFLTLYHYDPTTRWVEKIWEYKEPIDPASVGDPNPPSQGRPGASGFYEWQIGREPNCGVIETITEPDGGMFEFSFDAQLNMTRARKHANPGSSGGPSFLEWTWTYDSSNELLTLATPRANAAANPSDLTYTYTRTPDVSPGNPGGEILEISNPAGGIRPSPTVWRYRYDARGRLFEYEGPSHDGVQGGVYDHYTFHPAGTPGAFLPKRHATRRDLSIYTDFDYDAAGQLISGTLNTGEVFSQTWDAQGLLVDFFGPQIENQQYSAELRHDGVGRVVTFRYSYIGEAPKSGGASPTSVWIDVDYLYHPDDNVIKVFRDVDATSRAITEYYYDLEEVLIGVKDPEGKISGFSRDERGQPWEIVDAYLTSAQVTREVFYDEDGQVAFHTEPFKSGTSITVERDHDAFDRLTAFHVDATTRAEIELDPDGRMTRLRLSGDVSGTMTLLKEERYDYLDWHDNFTRKELDVYREDGSVLERTVVTEIIYGPSSKPLELHVGGEKYAAFEYEEWGAVKAVTDDFGNREDISYGAADGFPDSHVMTLSDPHGSGPVVYERQFEHDVLGRMTSVRYKAQGSADEVYSYGYDSTDNVVEFIDPAGVRTEASYRYDGLAVEVRRDVDQASGTAVATENFQYTPGGLLSLAIDAGSPDLLGANQRRTATFTYDLRNRKKREINSDGSYWEWQYNPGGFITRVITPKSKTFDFTYDLRGFPLTRTITEGAATLRTDSYDWDAAGFLKQVTKTEGSQQTSTSFVRDTTGRILSETTDGETVSYGRDALGRLTTLGGPSGMTRVYGYDRWNRVTSVGDGGVAPVATMSYLGPSSSLRRRLMRDGSQLDVGRDGFGRVESMTTSQGAVTQFDYRYRWDARGLLDFEDRLHDGQGDVFRYDGLNRLTSFTRNSVDPAAEHATPGSTTHAFEREFELDGSGHRVSVTTTPQGGGASVVDYLADPDRHHYTNVGGVVRTHDLDGNLLTHGARSFDYDATDQLVLVQDGAITLASYTYDALDRRVTKVAAGKTTRFVHAGPWLIEEYVDAGSGEQIEAIHFQGSGVDDLLMTRRRDRADLDQDNDTTELIDLYVHRNRLGSVMDLTLEDGTVVESYRYDAYGKPTIFDRTGSEVASAPSGNRFLFTGREYDEETGYFHYRARSYDPETGTFLQEDPLGLYAGLNPVSYVLNNAVLFSDPMGTDALSDRIWDLIKFIRDNASLIADVALDLLGPIADIIDVIGAVIGKNLRKWITNGFQGAWEALDTWDRITTGLVGAIGALGGAFSIIRKLDGIIEKIGKLVDAAKKGSRSAGDAAGSALAGAARSGCFFAGTLVLLASGDLMAIEDVELGDLVSCEVAAVAEIVPETEGLAFPDQFAEVGGEDWRRVDLVLIGKDATLSLLRPKAWVDARRLEVGSVFRLSMDEAHLSGDVRVRAIEAAPKVAHRSTAAGGVVTGVFKARADELVEIEFEGDSSGPLRVTPGHPIYSVTRGSWVPAGRLVEGEVLKTRGGGLAIRSISRSGDVDASVFNIEVQRSHTFFVAQARILAHNDCPGARGTPRAARREAMRGEGIPTSQQPVAQSSLRGPGNRPAGRQLEYDTPDGKKLVQHQLQDRNHGPHWEAGKPKLGGQTDPAGRPRLRNDKTRVDEEP